MEKEAVRIAFQRYWDLSAIDQLAAHEMYHEDAVLEFPQSQERFEGKAVFMEWRSAYPASVETRIERVRGGGDVWVVELLIRYDGGPWNHGCSILEFSADKVIRETIYLAEPWEAPEWRAPWRAQWQSIADDEGESGGRG